MRESKKQFSLKLDVFVFLCVFFVSATQLTAGNPHDQTRLDFVELSTGITMEYAERGTGNGHVVIFLHGYLDSWFSFSEIMTLLPKKYHSFSLSLRGFGESDKPQTGYQLTDYSADVIAFMDNLGIQDASIVGHSMGSMIAQRMAIDHPDRVKELVLAGSGVDMAENAVLQAFEGIVISLSDPISPTFIDELTEGMTINPVDRSFLDKLSSETLKVPAHVWREALYDLQAANNRDELSQIVAPTLILWGEADEIFTYEEQLELNDAIPSSMLLIYANSGHGVQWEFPNQLASDLAAFLR